MQPLLKKLASAGVLRLGLRMTFIIGGIALALFLLGIVQRNGWLMTERKPDRSAVAGDQPAGTAKRYICPMMCTPPLSEPGRCPVCAMELVEATTDAQGDGVSITIEPAARRLVGIQTAVAKLGDIQRTIRTIGSVQFDESRLSTISAYIDGRLEEVFANYVGVKVQKGDDLALIYSPQIFTAQTEYVTGLDNESIDERYRLDKNNLTTLARENLSELGMTESQLDRLTQSRTPQSRMRITSPQSGTVIERAVVQGDYVKTGQKLFRVADLSSVWLMLELFPDDAAAVRFGQQVEAEIQSLPGEVYTGRVAFIDPTVNPRSRTVQVRVEIINMDGKLRPGDYATARVSVPAIPMDIVYDAALANKFISPMHPQVIRDSPGDCPLCGMDLIPTSELGFASEPLPEQPVVTVPRNAVLLAGGNSVVYVETDPGRFEVRQVVLGPMNESDAVVVGGLNVGEAVATHGNFLIDSQMQLAGNPSLLDPTKAPAYAQGPLPLPDLKPTVLTGEVGEILDDAYEAYFDLQRTMAGDETPSPPMLEALLSKLQQLESSVAVPGNAQRDYSKARRATHRMSGSLEAARQAYRDVSHALLRAATVVIGPRTASGYYHMYCPMVPGGGGDWMQQEKVLSNPYWGSTMLRCGEIVARISAIDEGVQ